MHRTLLPTLAWLVPSMVLAAQPSTSTRPPRAKTAQQVIRCVCDTYRGHALTARFEQTYIDAVTGAKPQERGQVALDAQGRMQFAYEAPEQKTFVFDGQAASFVEHDAKQVTVLDHFSESQAGAALALLTGRLSSLDGIALDPALSAAAQKRCPPAEHALVFRPHHSSGGFATAELRVDANRCEIISVRVVDAIGNASQYRLKDRSFHTSLPDHLFVSSIPTGFDVLHVDATPQASASSPPSTDQNSR